MKFNYILETLKDWNTNLKQIAPFKIDVIHYNEYIEEERPLP